jgi:hypothetical protein
VDVIRSLIKYHYMLIKTLTKTDDLIYLKKYVQVRNNLLFFYDEEACREVYARLRALIRKSEPYLAKLNVDPENYILGQFENMLGFNSLRKQIETRRSGLIVTRKLHSENDPEDLIFPDKVVQSFITTAMEVYVGNRLYNLRNVQQEFLNAKMNWTSRTCGKHGGLNANYNMSNGIVTLNTDGNGTNDGPTRSIQPERKESGGIYCNDFTVVAINNSPGAFQITCRADVAGCNYVQYFWTVYKGNNANSTPLIQNFSTGSANYYEYAPTTTTGNDYPFNYYVCCTISSSDINCSPNPVTCCQAFTINKPSPGSGGTTPGGGTTPPYCCTPWYYGQNDTYYTHNGHSSFYRCRLALTNALFFTTLAARVYNFQKLWLHYYLHNADYLLAYANGQWHNQDCSQLPIGVSTGAVSNNNVSSVSSVVWVSFIRVIKYHEVLATYGISNGGYSNSKFMNAC